MNELTNDEIKAKKTELKKQIDALNDKISTPYNYRTKEGEPYVNSPNFKADKEKLSELVTEYGSLIVSRNVESATLKKSLSFSNGMYTLKYSPEKDRWDMYLGQEYKTSDIRFSEDGEEAEAHVSVCNSDTHGEVEDYVYTFKVASTPDAIVEKAQPVRCSKIIEGLSAQPSTDKEYLAKMGYVWDETYKKYRRMYPDEFCNTLKSVKEPQKKPSKISFSKFLKRKD